MKKEDLERIIELKLHQNLYVIDKGTTQKPDYVVGGTSDLKRELVNLFLLHFVSNNEVAVCDNCRRNKMLLKKPAHCKFCGDRIIK